jgi:large subunit ribosomal protein L21
VYAVVQSGGQQHKVKVGQTFMVEKIAGAAEVGARVELDRVLAIGGDDGSTIGTPTVAGARVVAEVVDPDAKGKKLIVFKYKAKVRYRRKTGHRQHYTQLKVTEIVTAEGSASATTSASERETAERGRPAVAPDAEATTAAVGQAATAEAVEDTAAHAVEAVEDTATSAAETANESDPTVGADASEAAVDTVEDDLPSGEDEPADEKKG